MKTHLKTLVRETLFTSIAAAALLLGGNSVSAEPKELPAGVTRVPVVFSGGHDTEGGIMLQNLPLESLQLGSGIKAELLGEEPASLFVRP